MILKPGTLLAIGFDADQISDQLAYSFFSTDGPQPRHSTGLFGGEIYFDKNSVFRLQVVGSGKIGRLHDFKVVDCTLITKPMIIKADSNHTRYAAPSPFHKCAGASHALPLDFEPAQSGDHDPATVLITKDWKHELNVRDVYGRWELSLIMTVEIVRRAGAAPELRVFSFDPESQVGAGGGQDGD
jgi:hypothetical protein